MGRLPDLQSLARKSVLAASVESVASQLVTQARASPDGGLQKLTKVDRSSPKPAAVKTNPTPARRALPSRALTIARLLAQGKRASEVAQVLGVTRQAIWKWSRLPEVDDEVARLHRELLHNRRADRPLVYKS